MKHAIIVNTDRGRIIVSKLQEAAGAEVNTYSYVLEIHSELPDPKNELRRGFDVAFTELTPNVMRGLRDALIEILK